MDEKDLEALFSVLKEDTGIADKETLSHIVSNEGIDVIYDYIQDGIFTDIETFKGAFPSLKKKEDIVSVGESGMQDGLQTEQPSTFIGSLGDPEAVEEALKYAPKYDQDQQDAPLSQRISQAEGDVTVQDIERDIDIRKRTEERKRKEDLYTSMSEREERAKISEFTGSEAFQFEISDIDDSKLNRSEDVVIPEFQKKYSKYGFTFAKDPWGNRMVVRNADGSNSITINLKTDPRMGDVAKGQADKLKEFISSNAVMPEEIKEEDYLTKSFNVKKSRKKPMKNEDGSVSTVRMASADNMAFPTIFPKDPNKPSSNPDDWFIFDISKREDIEAAIKMAQERGEIYKFDTPEEASEFAEGGWKDVSITDIEGEKFFKERGLDYLKVMKAEKRRFEVQDEIAFIEEQIGLNKASEYNPATGKMEGGYKPSEEVIKNNPDIYLPDGSLRSDVNEKLKKLKKENEDLGNIVYFDENARNAIQEYNIFLHKKYNEYQKEAIVQNKDLTNAFDNLNKEYQTGNISYDDYQIQFKSLAKEQQNVSEKYFLASTYLNQKTRQNIQGEFLDNFEAFSVELKKGIQNGNAASKMLAISLGLDPTNEYSAEELAMILKNLDKRQGRAFYNYMNSATAAESWDAFLSDPAEVLSSLVGNSLGQLLPLGWEIVSNTKTAAAVVLPGVAAGAAKGVATGNPFAAAIGGVGGGIAALSAATNFALEYSNAILDSARDKGYDLEDPEQALKALQDKTVWEEGSSIGTKRGLAIGLVELLSAGMAGKVFKVAQTASKTRKTLAFAAERVVFDPLSEGTGELLAQVVSGQEIDMFEIVNEAGGGFASNASTATLNIFSRSDKQAKINKAYELTSRDAIAKERSSFSEISNWTSEMKRLGQIDESVANAIQENLVLRNESNELLGLSKSKKNEKLVSRTMDLLKAQKTLNENENSKKIYKDELASIDNELSYMVKNGKLAPEENMTNIDNIKDETGEIVSLAPKTKSYSINGRRYSKAGFQQKFDKMSEQQKKDASFDIRNDEEFKAEVTKDYGVLPTQAEVTTDTKTEPVGPSIIEETLNSIDEVPTEVREAAVVVQEKEDGTFQIDDKVYDTIPEEVMQLDAVITQRQDGKVDMRYNEDNVIVEAAPITEVYDTMDAIPQTIQDATSTQIVENDEGKFEVTYKESEVIGQVLGKKKPPQFMMETKEKKYPIEDEGKWYGDGDYRQRGGVIVEMTPDEFLSRAKPLEMDEETRENVDDLKKHIQEGKKLDPLAIYENDVTNVRASDGRHRAIAAKELGLEKVPVLDFTLDEQAKQKLKDEAQLQLDTEVDTEARKMELEEQAIQQMEEVLPETSEIIEDVDQAEATSVEIKENEEAVNRTKIKRFKLKDIIGKSLNLLMADKLKIKLLDPSKPYNEKTNPYVKMGGPFFPLMEKLFGKVAWASIDDAAASKIIIGAMNGDYSAVYNMGDGGIDSNIVMAETLESKIPENQKAEIFKLIKEKILASKDEKIKKAHKYFKDAKNLMDAFEKMTNKDTKVGVDVRAAVIRSILPETVEGKTQIDLHNKLKELGISLEAIRDENAEQFTKDIPTGALTMIVEVHDENGVPVRERKAELDKKLENKEITKKQYNNEIKAIIESAKMSLEQQNKEGVPSHRNYPVYIRGKAIAVMEETAPFFNIIKKYSEQGEKRAAGIEKKKGVGVKKDATNLEKKIYDKFQEAKKLINDSKRDNNKKEEAKKIMRSLIRDAKKLDQEQRAEMVSGLKEALSSNNKADIKAALGRAEIPVSKMVDYTQKEIESAAVTSGATTSTTSYSITENLKNTYELFVERLSKAIPGIEVVTSQKEFDALLRDLNTKSLVNKDQKVYGAVYNGKLYLNPGIRNFNTPIHEFGHIWLNTVKELRRDLYDKGIELIQKDDTYINQIKNSKEYNKVIDQMKKDGKSQAEIDQYILEEALATAIGDKGESFANAAQTRNFKGWLTDLFNFVKKLTGISQLTADQVQNMTFDEFLQGVVVDLLSDNPLFKESEVKNLSNQLQMMSSDGSSMSIDQVISQARQEGFSDTSIKEYLKKQGYKVAEINQAMAIQLDINTQMPDAFVNVTGGSKVGIEMFNDIKKDLDNWIKSRWGKGKSFTEYRQKAMELLTEHETFKRESAINQEKLISAIDQVIGRKKEADVNAPIKSIKDTVKLLKDNDWKGNIKAVKSSLINATKPLQGSKLHGKNQKKIAGLINGITESNIDSQIKKIDEVLAEIMADNKAANKKMNNDISEINKKILAHSKGQIDAVKAIKEIRDVAKQLMKGTKYGPIFSEINKVITSTKPDNIDFKFQELFDLMNEFFALEQTSVDQIVGLETAIKNLKEKVRNEKKQARDLKDIKLKLTQSIKNTIQQFRELGVKDYSYSDVQRFIYKVNNANLKNIDKVAAQTANVFSNVEERARTKKKKDIATLIKKYAKDKKQSGRRIGRGTISADGQAFFEAANNFMQLLDDKNISIEQIKQALDLRDILNNYDSKTREDMLKNDEAFASLSKLIESIDKILERESSISKISSIPDILLGLENMTLEELNFLENDFKNDKLVFAEQLANKKAIEKEIREQLINEGSDQIKEKYDALYKEEVVDGESVLVSKDSDELSKMKEPFKKIFKDKGTREAFKAMINRFKLSNIFVNFAGHLTAICNNLDNIPGGKDFFTKNIVQRLNKSRSNFTKGLQSKKEKLDLIAASINPNYTYDKIKSKIYKTADIVINGETYTGDQQMRIYALLKNDLQRSKLKEENKFKDADIMALENNLDPEVKQFADMIVEYLSNEYYAETNNVYRDVNNINLPKIDNYFPTQTVTTREKLDDNVKALAEIATGKFTAQGESFLKQRTATKGKVAMMYPNTGIPYTFTGSLDTLIEGSERFKAYAKDAKILNALLSSPEISNLLRMTGLKDLVNRFINNEINPISSQDPGFWNNLIKTAFGKYISVALSFKFWQIPKQASSFIWAFTEHEASNVTKDLPTLIKFIPNLVSFLARSFNILKIHKAYKTSPMFRERVQRFRKSGFSSLETTLTEEQANSVVNRILKNIEKAGQSFTFIGDILGVMGYWINYETDIKNGMNPAKALEKFENYNKTQQTQRGTEINKWQLASRENPMWMALTTFMSTQFLMNSIIMESLSNMSKQVKNAKGAKKIVAPFSALFNSKDGLRFMFAMGIANAAFAAVANAFKYIEGDDEDKEDFKMEVKKAATGFNNFTSLPFFGQSVETLYDFAYDNENVYKAGESINPISLMTDATFKSLKTKENKLLNFFGKEEEKKSLQRTLFEYASGINTDPFVGMYKFMQGEQDALKPAMGITKSYLPKTDEGMGNLINMLEE